MGGEKSGKNVLLRRKAIRFLIRAFVWTLGAGLGFLVLKDFFRDLYLRFWLETAGGALMAAAFAVLAVLLAYGTLVVFQEKKFYPALLFLVMPLALSALVMFLADIYVVRRVPDLSALARKDFKVVSGRMKVVDVKITGRHKKFQFSVAGELFRLHPSFYSQLSNAFELEIKYLPSSRAVMEFKVLATRESNGD